MLKNRNKILFSFIVSGLLLFSGVFSAFAAEEAKVQLTTAQTYSNALWNYSAEILVPQIEGLADADAQSKLNKGFLDHAAELIKSFESDARSVHDQYPADGPHYLLQYKYEVAFENETHLVFRVYEYTAAGSSNFSAQYFTIDKTNRKLVSFADMTNGKTDALQKIEDYLIEEMRKANKSTEQIYWVDDKSIGSDWKGEMDKVFAKIEENRQYYLNPEGKLVIAFNKYEVGPGVMGAPEFVIPDEIYK